MLSTNTGSGVRQQSLGSLSWTRFELFANTDDPGSRLYLRLHLKDRADPLLGSVCSLFQRPGCQANCGCLGSRLIHLKAGTEFFQKNFSAANCPFAIKYECRISSTALFRPA